VQMHKGGEGTHKSPGTEIWVFDLASHQRIGRWSVHGLGPVQVVQVTRDAAPLLFAATEAGDLGVFDARDGRLRHVEKHLGQTLWMMLTP
jgi:methylamine dehydrogenase heavy chain